MFTTETINSESLLEEQRSHVQLFRCIGKVLKPLLYEIKQDPTTV